jgi:hypothetical protein
MLTNVANVNEINFAKVTTPQKGFTELGSQAAQVLRPESVTFLRSDKKKLEKNISNSFDPVFAEPSSTRLRLRPVHSVQKKTLLATSPR